MLTHVGIQWESPDITVEAFPFPILSVLFTLFEGIGYLASANLFGNFHC